MSQDGGGLNGPSPFLGCILGMGKIPPAMGMEGLGLLLEGGFMQFSLCLLGHPPLCECLLPAWLCIHVVCARRCRSVRIPVRKALWLPHFGHLSNYRIFLQESSSVQFAVKCRLAVMPGLESSRCPTLGIHPASPVPSDSYGAAFNRGSGGFCGGGNKEGLQPDREQGHQAHHAGQSWRHCEALHRRRGVASMSSWVWGSPFVSISSAHRLLSPCLAHLGGKVTALPPLTFPRVANPTWEPGGEVFVQQGLQSVRGETAPGKVKFHLVVLLGILFFPTRRAHPSRMLCHHEVLLLLPVPGEAMQAALLQPQRSRRLLSLVLPHRASFCFPPPAFLLLLPQRLLWMFLP